MKEKNKEEYIDLAQIFKTLWKNAAIILLTGVLGAGLFFSYARAFVSPSYEANVLFYVNNSSLTIGATSVNISTGELNAASSLVSTYVAILQSRANMEMVAKQSGLNYSYDQLRKMVSARAVNSTGLFQITVTSSNPEYARMLANTIADVLPEKISDIVHNSDVKVVDYAVTPQTRSAPNYTNYALSGLVAGMALASALVLLRNSMDTIIHNEDYLTLTYDAPILSSIPDLLSHSSSKYGYGYYSSAAATNKKKGGMD